MEKYRPLFINGEWVEPTSGKKGNIINPSNEEVIAEYAIGTKEDVKKAVKAAKDAYYGGWNKVVGRERSEYLNKLADLIENNIIEFSRLESIEVGKPISTVEGEMMGNADSLRYFATTARNPEGKPALEYERNLNSAIRREPLGVTAGICPWNYPLQACVWKIGASLAAGNTIVIKPASNTPLTTLYFAELAADVLNVVTGPGSELGEELCSNTDVALISLTGDSKTGKQIQAACAPTLKRVLLELGGKAPLLVFEDADIDGVVAKLKGASFENCGQSCGQVCRVLVAKPIYKEFVDKFVEMVKNIKVGPIEDESTEMGPLVSSKQRERVHSFVENAVAVGAKVLTGGHIIEGKGFYYEPTVIVDVKQDSEIIQKEVFGPVVTIQSFESEQEAIDMANGTVYGLGSGLYTKDNSRAMRVMSQLEFGTVWINTYGEGPCEMPWGGYKESGHGKDLSMYAMEDYTQVKHVVTAF